MKELKRSSKTIDIVSCALEVSVNGVTYVFVVHFRSPELLKFVNWLTSLRPYMSTKTCVTGNNMVLHKSPFTGNMKYPCNTCPL